MTTDPEDQPAGAELSIQLEDGRWGLGKILFTPLLLSGWAWRPVPQWWASVPWRARGTCSTSGWEQSTTGYNIRLKTEELHPSHSFSIKSTCVVRSLESFYQLRRILKVSLAQAECISHDISRNATTTWQYLPCLSSPPSGSQAISQYAPVWLSSYLRSAGVGSGEDEPVGMFQVLSLRELLSNKALHLYLQTRLSMEDIKENVEGKRDDDVAMAVADLIKVERNVAREGFGDLFGGTSS